MLFHKSSQLILLPHGMDPCAIFLPIGTLDCCSCTLVGSIWSKFFAIPQKHLPDYTHPSLIFCFLRNIITVEIGASFVKRPSIFCLNSGAGSTDCLNYFSFPLFSVVIDFLWSNENRSLLSCTVLSIATP